MGNNKVVSQVTSSHGNFSQVVQGSGNVVRGGRHNTVNGNVVGGNYIAGDYVHSRAVVDEKPATQEKNLPFWDKVVVQGTYSVVIDANAPASCKIEAAEHVMKNISLEVKDNTLYLSTSGAYTTSLPVCVHLTTPELNEVLCNGTADTRITNLSTPALVAVNEGTGDLALSGKVDKLSITASGTGDTEVNNISTKDLTVANSGNGEMRIALTHPLSSIELNNDEQAGLTVQNIFAPALTITNHGMSKVRVSGGVQTLDITQSSNGKVDASELQSSQCHAVVCDQGKIVCQASQQATLSAQDMSKIEFEGTSTPSIQVLDMAKIRVNGENAAKHSKKHKW